MVDDNLFEDVNIEPGDEMVAEESAEARIKKLRDELKQCQQKNIENLAGWQRCKADAINARQDALRNAERSVSRMRENFLEDLLPSLDAFDMAMGSESWNTVSAEWQKGMERVHAQLLELLRKNDVERFGSIGDMFDPSMHEALLESDDIDAPTHAILKVVRYGYKSPTFIIRPAQVIIRK